MSATPRQVLQAVAVTMQRLGFNTNEEISGADTVQELAIHWPDIKRVLKTPPGPLTPLEQEMAGHLKRMLMAAVKHRWHVNSDERDVFAEARSFINDHNLA